MGEQESLFNTRSMVSSRVMRKVKRKREIERLRLQRKIGVDVASAPNWENIELNYPREERDWTVYAGPCPMCGTKGQHLLQVRDNGNSFRMKCHLQDACGYATNFVTSAKLAIQCWKVHAALVK